MIQAVTCENGEEVADDFKGTTLEQGVPFFRRDLDKVALKEASEGSESWRESGSGDERTGVFVEGDDDGFHVVVN